MWDFGDGIKVTQEDPTHVYALSGNYLVKLIALNFICGNDTIEKWVNITIAGNETIHASHEINIFPNPSDGNIRIDLPSIPAGDIYIRIYNLTGKEILSEKYAHTGLETTIEKDLTALDPGLYFIKIESSLRSMVKKIYLEP